MKNIKSIRKSKGYTLEELSKHTGIRVPWLSAYENDRAIPPLNEILRLEAILGEISWNDPIPSEVKRDTVNEIVALAGKYPLPQVLTAMGRKARQLTEQYKSIHHESNILENA